MLTFGSLFAGIGGMDLGFERAGMVCKWQVEIDDYARRVLAKHWPDVRRHDDVRTFPPSDPSEWQVDCIAGGFPCQDISFAGRRDGLDGERSGLWWEFARIIRILRPRYVVVENVPGLLAPVRDGEQAPIGCVLGELAACGFDAEWDCLPASAFGAHFRGDRVFIVANRAKASCLRRQRKWENPTRAFAGDEFARLVERELQICVPASKGQRVSDGVSRRVDRLRVLGNSIVPQVAEYIARRILAVTEDAK